MTAPHHAPHCNTLQHTLQHTATRCNIHCNTLRLILQRTAMHTATHCTMYCNTLHRVLQHTAPYTAYKYTMIKIINTHSKCPVIQNLIYIARWLVEKKSFPLPFRGGGKKKGDKKKTKTGGDRIKGRGKQRQQKSKAIRVHQMAKGKSVKKNLNSGRENRGGIFF